MIGLVSLGFTAFGLFIISKFIDGFEFTLLFGGLIFLWFGIGFFMIVFGHLKTITIYDKKN
jgi:hypothetical protein